MPEILLKKEEFAQRFGYGRGISALLYLVLAAFLLGLAAYGGLFLLNRGQEAAKEELISEIQAKEKELRPEALNQIFFLDARLASMRNLLSSHLFISKIFQFLEQNAHQQVRFVNFNFAAENRRLDMSAEGKSYGVLAGQISLLERNPYVERVEFGGLSLGAAGLVNFKLTIIFKPSLLRLGS